jgi:HEAT repeat protein
MLARLALSCTFLVCWLVSPAAHGEDNKEPRYRGKTAAYWVERLNADARADREKALGALLNLAPTGSVTAVTALTEMLSDRDAEFRLFAVRALGEFESKAEPAVPALLHLLAQHHKDDPHLAKVEPPSRYVGPNDFSFLGHYACADNYFALLATLGSIGGKASAAAPLVKDAFDKVTPAKHKNSAYLKQKLIEAMGRLGAGAAPVLMDIFENTDKDWVREAIAVALARMGPAGKSAAPRLAQLLPRCGKLARPEAAWALWQMDKRPLALSTLVKVLDEQATAKPKPSAKPELVVPTAFAATDAPKEYSTYANGEPTSPAGRLWDNLPGICACLAAAGPAAKTAVPALRRLLSNNDRAVRIAAAEALWRVAKSPESVSTLEKCVFYEHSGGLLDGKTWVDSNAVRLLGEIGPEARSALPILEKADKLVLTLWPDTKLTESLPNLFPGGSVTDGSVTERLTERGEIARAIARIAPERAEKK